MHAPIRAVGGRRRAPVGRERAWQVVARASALLACVLVAVVLGAPSAQAHALLVRSDPASGSVLEEPPTVITLWFDEEISQPLSSVRLVDDGGRTLGGTQVGTPSDDERIVTVTLPRLGDGSYGVLWQVLAQDDGHTSSGTVVFTVGEPSGQPGPEPTVGAGPTPFDVALRWARIGALAALVGALVVRGLVLGRSRTELSPPLVLTLSTTRRRLLAMAIAAAAVGALVGLVDLVAEVRRLRPPGSPWAATVGGLLGDARWGRLWLAREVALVVVVVLLGAARSRGGVGRWALPGAGAAALALVAVEALGSHAAAADTDRTWVIAVDAVHVLTACVWLGAVAALGVMLWPHAAGASGGALARAHRDAFSRILVTSVVLVLASGLYGGGRQVASVDDLVTTTYGRTLLVKLALVSATLGLGFVNSTRLHGVRVLGARRPLSRRLVAVEVGVAAVLLVAVGALVETAPRGVEGTAPPASGGVVSGSAADLVVTVAATPGRPGLNGFTVTVASTRRPAPASVDGVALELVGGGVTSALTLQLVDGDRYFGTAEVATSGPVAITAVVDRAGAQVQVPIVWRADPPDSRPTVSRSLAPYANGLAVLLVVVALVAVTTRRRAQRRRTVLDQHMPVQDDDVVASHR